MVLCIYQSDWNPLTTRIALPKLSRAKHEASRSLSKGSTGRLLLCLNDNGLGNHRCLAGHGNLPQGKRH